MPSTRPLSFLKMAKVFHSDRERGSVKIAWVHILPEPALTVFLSTSIRTHGAFWRVMAPDLESCP
jgi:hypothetical protein